MNSKAKPSVVIRESDFERLCRLTDRAPTVSFEAVKLLRDELERAVVARDSEALGVQMGARVRFREHGSGMIHEFRLVYPGEADIISGRISVLTPVGAALLGLQEGASLEWLDHVGGAKKVTVLAVDPPIS